MKITRQKVLYCSLNSYLDTSNGAAVASRSLAESLARLGFRCEAITGAMLENGPDMDPADWLTGLGLSCSSELGSSDHKPPGHLIVDRLEVGAIPVSLHRSVTTKLHAYDSDERSGFLSLFERTLDRLRPDIFINYGSDQLSVELRSRASSREVAVVVPVHNFSYSDPATFASADAVLTASRFAKEYYEFFLGLEFTVLPYTVSRERISAPENSRKFLTFINPSLEKGVFAFARIAETLGRKRPDIPILVVEGRGTEATVAACGLELRKHGNVFFMPHTRNPAEFWSLTKICLLPSLWWENQPLVAVEAMLNGIPVIGTDRGGIPDTLGDAGIVLPLPDRITPATRFLPTAEEVAPWIESVIRLWDDTIFYTDQTRRALAEARRWSPEVIEPQYLKVFSNIKAGAGLRSLSPSRRAKAVILVPYLGTIEQECEGPLRLLESSGVKVIRSGGNSAIDIARNRLASQALHDGYEDIFFIDSDIGFDHIDALRMLARPEPVVAGVYAKKGERGFASVFADETREVIFGRGAFGLYPLKYAATGFLRIKSRVLWQMIADLQLPHCNTHWGKGDWPFFQPLVVPQGDGREHYLGEDWAFSHRLAQIGVTPMADTSIRLWHYGKHGYGWEDVGCERKRFSSYTHQFF